jgi:hypothetical protein
MGTLGSDFLSSLPLHEYPPAFPLGADIQGMTLILRWSPSPEPLLLSKAQAILSSRGEGVR